MWTCSIFSPCSHVKKKGELAKVSMVKSVERSAQTIRIPLTPDLVVFVKVIDQHCPKSADITVFYWTASIFTLFYKYMRVCTLFQIVLLLSRSARCICEHPHSNQFPIIFDRLLIPNTPSTAPNFVFIA
jgi:hypothetical protein